MVMHQFLTLSRIRKIKQDDLKLLAIGYWLLASMIIYHLISKINPLD